MAGRKQRTMTPGDVAGHVPAPRNIACARCGTVFTCDLAGNCWCTQEEFRLPLPETMTEDCLCPTCLRAEAAVRVAARAQSAR